MVHPVADDWSDDYLVFTASSTTVLLSEPFANFLAYAVSESLRPILMTRMGARVGPFVSMAMREAGGFWVVMRRDGALFNGLSGFRVPSYQGLWEPPTQETQRLPTFMGWTLKAEGALMFEVFAHQRAAPDTQIGALSQAVVAALGGEQLDVSGLFEPLTDVWDQAAITEWVRGQMPAADVLHSRGPDGSSCNNSAGRTSRGILEHVKGGVPIGDYPTSIGDVVGAALAHIAQHFQPTIGLVSLMQFDPGLTQGASPRPPEAPLAVLIESL